jgi:DNA polymerase sigma
MADKPMMTDVEFLNVAKQLRLQARFAQRAEELAEHVLHAKVSVVEAETQREAIKQEIEALFRQRTEVMDVTHAMVEAKKEEGRKAFAQEKQKIEQEEILPLRKAKQEMAKTIDETHAAQRKDEEAHAAKMKALFEVYEEERSHHLKEKEARDRVLKKQSDDCNQRAAERDEAERQHGMKIDKLKAEAVSLQERIDLLKGELKNLLARVVGE